MQSRGCHAKCRVCQKRAVAWEPGFFSTVCGNEKCRTEMKKRLQDKFNIFISDRLSAMTKRDMMRLFQTRLRSELRHVDKSTNLPDFGRIGAIIEEAMLMQATRFKTGRRMLPTQFIAEVVDSVYPYRRDYHLENAIEAIIANPRMVGFVALAKQIFQSPQQFVVI